MAVILRSHRLAQRQLLKHHNAMDSMMDWCSQRADRGIPVVEATRSRLRPLSRLCHIDVLVAGIDDLLLNALGSVGRSQGSRQHNACMAWLRQQIIGQADTTGTEGPGAGSVSM